MTQITVFGNSENVEWQHVLSELLYETVGFSAGLKEARNMTELDYLPPAVLTALVYDILSLCCADARCIAFCCLMLKS